MRSANSTRGQTFVEEARRRQLVDAAIATIAELGYQPASLARIAERAGVSKSAVMYHFTGRDELIEQVVATVNDAAAAVMVPAQQGATDPADRLVRYIRSNLAFLRDQPDHVCALVAIYRDHRPAAGPSWVDPMVAAAMDPLTDLLRYGQDEKVFTTFDVRVMARTLRAAIDAVSNAVAEKGDIDVDAEAEELVALFARATGARQDGGDQ